MRLAFIFFACGWCLVGFSQKTKRVSGSYKMKIESHMSEAQAIQAAVDQARVEAMKNEFGTRISSMNQTRMETVNGSTNTSFNTIANSLVKGVWLQDLSEPKIEIINPGNERWVSVEVTGKARNLDDGSLQLEVRPLSCQNIGCQTQEFRHNGTMYLYFRSPVNGFVSVYMDDKSNAFMMLPYSNMKRGSFEIEADKEYIFFSRDPAHNYTGNIGDVDEYQLQTPYQYEIDLLYVLFSQYEFAKPILENSDGIKYTSSAKFNNWLGLVMSGEDMYMEVIDVSISK